MSLLISDCQKCLNLGFRLPVSIDRKYPHGIPFAIAFERALPCDCSAGRWWLTQQLEYIDAPQVPIPIRELRPAIQISMFKRAV